MNRRYAILMPQSDRPKPLPPGVAAEGVAKADKRGKPYNFLPVKTIMRRLIPLQRMVIERGEEAFDPGFEARRQALWATLAYEYAMQAEDDEGISPLKKADLSVRSAPFINLLLELAPKDNAKYPKTEAAISQEALGRLSKLGKLTPDADASAILDAMAPATQQPAEEA